MTEQTLVEGESGRPFVGDGAELAELRARSRELRVRLGLPAEPFVIDQTSGSVRARGLAGFVNLGRTTLQIVPGYLRHDPDWAASLLTMLARVHALSWSPPTSREIGASGPADVLAAGLTDAVLRAVGHGWRPQIAPSAPDAAAVAWACGELIAAVGSPRLRAEVTEVMELVGPTPAELPSLVARHASPGALSEALDVVRLLAMGQQSGPVASADTPRSAFAWSTERLFGDFVHLVAEQAAAAQAGLTASRGARARRLVDASAAVDVVIESPTDLVAAAVCGRDCDDALVDQLTGPLIASAMALQASDIAVVFPASRGPQSGTRLRVRQPGGPGLLHLLTVEPSGLSEPGAMERIVDDFGLDLSMMLTFAHQRRAEIGLRERWRDQRG